MSKYNIMYHMHTCIYAGMYSNIFKGYVGWTLVYYKENIYLLQFKFIFIPFYVFHKKSKMFVNSKWGITMFSPYTSKIIPAPLLDLWDIFFLINSIHCYNYNILKTKYNKFYILSVKISNI